MEVVKESNGYPDRSKAEIILQESERLNPGSWGDHSRVVAKCAETIAARCEDLDSKKAYVLGLLHDIGRRFGVKHFAHVYDGYMYMGKLGYPDVARICLTHSFSTKKVEDYSGNFDVTPQQRQIVENALAECVYDDYDRLIQLCDSIGMAEGAAQIEKRMGDVKSRYGYYPQSKWDKNIELKKYFENKVKCNIEELTADIRLDNRLIFDN